MPNRRSRDKELRIWRTDSIRGEDRLQPTGLRQGEGERDSVLGGTLQLLPEAIDAGALRLQLRQRLRARLVLLYESVHLPVELEHFPVAIVEEDRSAAGELSGIRQTEQRADRP